MIISDELWAKTILRWARNLAKIFSWIGRNMSNTPYSLSLGQIKVQKAASWDGGEKQIIEREREKNQKEKAFVKMAVYA